MGLSVHILAIVVSTSLILYGCDSANDSRNSTPTATAMGDALPEVVAEIHQGMVSRDGAALRALLAGEPLPCTTTESIQSPGIGGGLPQCADGIPEGTLVGEYVGFGDCEGWRVPADDAFVQRVLELGIENAEFNGAVLAVADAAIPEPFYSLVYTDPDGDGRIIRAGDDGIIGLLMGCGAEGPELYDSLAAIDGAVAYSAGGGS